VSRYTFRVGRGVLRVGSSSLLKAARKFSYRLGLEPGAEFSGYTRKRGGRWVRFRVGRSARMVERVRRAA